MLPLLLLLFWGTAEAQTTLERLRLMGGDNPCEGYIEVLVKTPGSPGTWGLVGDDRWKPVNDQVVCKSIGCGEPHNVSSVERPVTSTITWMNEVDCKGYETNISQCTFPGWKISVYESRVLRKIRCSGKIELSLDDSYSKCAGVVRYNSLDGSGYFCHADGKDEDDLMCKALNCGNHKTIPKLGFGREIASGLMKPVKCIGGENHIWQCVNASSQICQKPFAVICSGHRRLRLQGGDNRCAGTLEVEVDGAWRPVSCQDKEYMNPASMCKQMRCGDNGTREPDVCDVDKKVFLKCSDHVSVTLRPRDRTTSASPQCYGMVQVNRSRVLETVCSASSDIDNGQVVCRELGCGDSISASDDSVSYGNSNELDQQLDQTVYCKGSETSMWHCLAQYGRLHKSECNAAYVICENSIEVRLQDGLGRCSGRLEVFHNGKWKKVSSSGWTQLNSDRVCKDLRCGNTAVSGDGLFAQGGRDTPTLDKKVTCGVNSRNFAKCITNIPLTSVKSPVMITCEDQRDVFLKGATSCSGLVSIKHSGATYWLAGSNTSWTGDTAAVVCRQLHCGDVGNVRSVPVSEVPDQPMWREMYRCVSSDGESLFDCNSSVVQSNHSSVAHVTCSGHRSVGLQNQCWGEVKVCVNNNECGSVCEDTWTHSFSSKLCAELDCGLKIPVTKARSLSGVMVSSLHAPGHTTNLSQYTMVLKGPCMGSSVSVSCSGSFKARLVNDRDRCSGNLQLFYPDNWLHVCRNAMDTNAQHAICREVGCGEALRELEYFGPPPSNRQPARTIGKMDCPQNSLSSANCSLTTKSSTCLLGGLQCSEWQKMRLFPEPTKEACEGRVFILSEGNSSMVSSDGWTAKEGQVLCQDLDCGDYITHEPRAVEAKVNWWDRKKYNCNGKEKIRNIWDCEEEGTPKLGSELYLKCKAGHTQFTLSQNCSGDVMVSGAGVCDVEWRDDLSALVCQSQGCGNPIKVNKVKKPNKAAVASLQAYNVRCSDPLTYPLDQCRRTKGSCSEGLVSLYCTGNVKFNTTERCGGKVQVNYRREWEFVFDTLGEKCKNLLCEKLGCGYAMKYGDEVVETEEALETDLSCFENHNDISYCVNHKPFEKRRPAKVYCQGYQKSEQGRELPVPLIVGLSIVAFTLFMVIFIFLLLRHRIKNRVMERFYSRKDSTLDSGEYEDVKPDIEMIKLNRMGSRSNGGKVTSDTGSASSLSYDDVAEEEVTSAQLISDVGEKTCAEDEDRINGSLKDRVTYEVEEDAGESYDDVAQDPEVVQQPESQPGNCLGINDQNPNLATASGEVTH